MILVQLLLMNLFKISFLEKLFIEKNTYINYYLFTLEHTFNFTDLTTNYNFNVTSLTFCYTLKKVIK